MIRVFCSICSVFAIAVIHSGCVRLPNIVNAGDVSKFTEIRAVPYSLPKGYVGLTLTKTTANSVSAITAKLDGVSYYPDRNFKFAIDLNHDRIANDNIVIETDDNGLLKAVTTTSSDQTPILIGKVVDLATAVAKIPAAFAGDAGAAPPETISVAFNAFDGLSDINAILTRFDAEISIVDKLPARLREENVMAACEGRICFRPVIPVTFQPASVPSFPRHLRNSLT